MRSQRPISAQIDKPSTSPAFRNLPEIHPGGLPPVGSGTRIRPTTAINQQSITPSNDPMRNMNPGIIEELEPEEEARLAEKLSYGEQHPQSQDIFKLMPKNIKMEKEKLYEDTLHLKQHIHVLKEENTKVKTRNLNLERDNAKLIKTLEKVGNTSTVSINGRTSESALVVTLKKQVKETKEELKVKQEEIEAMKKNTKYTRVQELEIELRAYIDENIRLKNMFEELMRAKPQVKIEDFNMLQDRFVMQSNFVETLQRENMRLNNELRHIEEQNFNLQTAREQDLKNAQKQQSEIVRLRKQVNNKVASTYKMDKSGIVKVEEKTKPSSDEVDELKKQLEQKEKVISQRDKTIEDLKQKLNERMANEIKEKQRFNFEMSQIKEQYIAMESKYRILLNMQYSNGQGRVAADNQQVGYESEGMKVKRLTLEDVSHIGYELRVKLQTRKIPLEGVIASFDRFGQQLALADMKTLLAYDPFGIKDETNALMVARYLVEPKNEEMISFDISTIQDIAVIKEGLRNLIGSYSLYNDTEMKDMNEDLCDLIIKHDEKLKEQFKAMPEAKTGYLSSEQIKEAFKGAGVVVDNKTFEYLIMTLYEYTGNLKRLDYMKMFEAFETEDHKKIKSILEMYQDPHAANSEKPEKKVKPNNNLQKSNDSQKSKSVSRNSPEPQKEEEKEEEEEEEVEEEYDQDYHEEEEDDDENDVRNKSI